MPEAATILHADLDAFYASVEQRDDPALRGRPVVVGTGVVLAASYEARAYGVGTAMSAARARQLCPHAVVVRPRMSAYLAASRAVFAVFAQTTPLVEALSIDEAFLDVGGLHRIAGPPVQIAAQLRRGVLEQVGLPITVGVARTKFLAKVASGVAKPDGLLLVEPEHELAFLHPLPVQRLWGVGPVTAATLQAHGIHTVGQLADTADSTLVDLLGRAAGRHLAALASNRDPRPVQPGRRRRSIGAQRALGHAPTTPESLDAHLRGLVDRVARRLRAAERSARTVVLRLRFADYTRASRSHTLPEATTETELIVAVARGLLRSIHPLIGRKGITLIGVALSNLEDGSLVQLSLPFDRPIAAGSVTTGSVTTGPASTGAARTEIDTTMDAIRDRFGTAAITRAVLLGHDDGLQVPLLPD